MKRNILIFLFLLVAGIGVDSCTKSDLNDPDCGKGYYGTIVVTNTSTQPYDLYVDDQFQVTILANSSTTHIHIKEGKHRKIYVKETNGTVVSPAEATEYIDVTHCNDYTWQIP